MKRVLVRVAVAIALVAAGWGLGRVENWGPRENYSFVLTIDAPTGSTTLHCRDCELITWTGGQRESSTLFDMTCKGPAPCRQLVGGHVRGPRVMAAAARAVGLSAE